MNILLGDPGHLSRSSIHCDEEAQGFEEHSSNFNFLLLATSLTVGKRELATVSAASAGKTKPSTESP